MIAIMAFTLSGGSKGFAGPLPERKTAVVRNIITSDTILSGMVAALLPSDRYSVDAILPSAQCPGHYDVKLSDVEKMKKADLTVLFKGMAYMDKSGQNEKMRILVEAQGRNWMAPDSYIYGLTILAGDLLERFPEDREEILKHKEAAIREVRAEADLLTAEIKQAGIFGKPIIASSMQKEPLEWMGFRVIGEYGRPESLSAREIVSLVKLGKEQKAVAIVDNLQSGPDSGKGIAETLKVPHVVLTNFPSEKGYIATLRENVSAVLSAARPR